MMEIFKIFSDKYANGVTAIATLFAVFLAFITLWFLRREYINKYHPYVVAIVLIEPRLGADGFDITLMPKNIGAHPCEIKILNIELHIGDEVYETPDLKDWILLAPQGVEIRMPAGYVNEIGTNNIREARYKKNRIEISFLIKSRSVEKLFEKSQSYQYEINLLGETPFAALRPS